jgi:branched-chain amino acid transport system permease protein
MAGIALLDQLLNGLTIGMVYVLLAAGLSIIFGVMDVINFAHGELFALGAYFALALVTAPFGGFWLALLVAPLAVAVVGGAMERFTVRRLYGRNPLYNILLTFGLVLVFKDVIEFIWGTQPYQLPTPDLLAGTVAFPGGYSYAAYNIFVILAGAVLAGGTWAALEYTKYGLIVRAGAMDREMVRYLGIDVDRYYTLVFSFGAMLAAFGGIVLAGRQSVNPGLGDSVIIPAFVIVVIGGLGSFRGAVVGGLGVGVVQTLMRSYFPVLEGLVVFLLMILVLLVRPQGLFGTSVEEAGGELLTASGGVLTAERRRQLGMALVGILALMPLGVGLLYSAYTVNTLLVTILAWALFALSLDFVMGYAGLVSLGHVIFYGVGAYTTVLVGMHLTPSVFLALLAGVVVCLPLAWIIGQLSIRVAGVYFAMITLGFAELFAELPFKTAGINGYLDSLGFLPAWLRAPELNGENGLFGVDFVYGLASGPEVGSVELFGDAELFFYLVLVAVVGSYLLARRLMDAPFGSVLLAIRESERRATFVGYDVTAYKRRAFVVSGGLAGLAGGLQAISTGGVAPNFLHWIKSGEVIVMTILGGMGTLYGPMLGAGVFLGLKEFLLTQGIDQWQGVLGVIFVVVVIFLPEGLVSLPATLSEYNASRDRGSEATAADDPEVSD